MGIIEERTGSGTRFRRGTLGTNDALARRDGRNVGEITPEIAEQARREMLSELEETDPLAYLEALKEIERESEREEERRRRVERAAEMRAATRMERRRS